MPPSTIKPSASTPTPGPSISLLPSIRLEPPRSDGDHLPGGNPSSHRCQVILVDDRIVGRCLQCRLRRIHDLVECRRAGAVVSGAVQRFRCDVIGGDVLGGALVLDYSVIEGI